MSGDSPKQICYQLSSTPQLMLGLHLATGAQHALPYAQLTYVGHAPNQPLELHFLSHQVHITGRKLRHVILHLQQHRIEWIAESKFFPARSELDVWVAGIQLNRLGE